MSINHESERLGYAAAKHGTPNGVQSFVLSWSINIPLLRSGHQRDVTVNYRHGTHYKLGQRIFTALPASSAMTSRETIDCVIISSLAQRDKGAVSVGEKAVLVLNARKR